VIFALCALGLVLFDAQNLLAWWRGWTLAAAAGSSDDYTIIVPVYGHRRYFDERSGLEPFRARVLVVVDVAGEGCLELAAELRDQGWRVHTTRVERPNPPRLLLCALRAAAVTTRYAMRMDADSRPLEDPGRYVAAMAADGCEFASVRVVIEPGHELVERMQALEYRMAMLSRRFRPWLSSGACFVGETARLAELLDQHTCWFPGEDLETGRIALARRLRVRHLDLRVATAAASGWRALLRQRRSWWAGGFRHAVVCADKNLCHTPIWTLYYGGLVCAGIVFKVAHVMPVTWLSLGLWFLALNALYVIVTVCANWQVRSWWMLLYPPYALVQTVGMPTAGAFWFAAFAVQQRSLGRYRFGYRRTAAK
jgi:Glycosyl transferase family group 2